MKGRPPVVPQRAVAYIRKRLAAGDDVAELASAFGVSRATVYRIRDEAAACYRRPRVQAVWYPTFTLPPQGALL